MMCVWIYIQTYNGIRGLPLIAQIVKNLPAMQETPVPGSGRSSGEGLVYSLQCSWASLVAQLVKNPPAVRETWVDPWIGKIPWIRERLPTPVSWPGEFHGLYSPRSRKELNTTKQLSHSVFKTAGGENKSWVLEARKD